MATTAACAEVPGVPLTDSVPHMITTGEASVEVMPDQADLSLVVSREGRTADAAADATAKEANEVIAAIKARGIEPRDIHTSFGLAPIFDARKANDDAAGTSRGYEASEHIAVRLHDIAKAGVIARDLFAKDANYLKGVAFSFSKEAQRRRDLDAEAMRDALQQAKVYTDAIGLRLGAVLEIGQDPSMSRQTLRDPGSAASGKPTEKLLVATEPEPLHLQETVTVVWQIEGRVH